MISGTLPNGTVWWISKDGKKVWIESKELENQKFIDKGYNIVKDRIFNPKIKKQVGELTGSRLERRLYQDSWIITLNTLLDVYPDLVSEIGNKRIEEKKKKRQAKSKTESKTKSKSPILPQELSKDIEKNIEDEQEDELLQEDWKQQEKIIENVHGKQQDEDAQEKRQEKKIEKSYFDVTYPYVEWIKGEIDKSPDEELKILSDDMKEKMGKEYINMHVIRIYYGLKKILPGIGIDVELGKLQGKSALIMKKVR